MPIIKRVLFSSIPQLGIEPVELNIGSYNIPTLEMKDLFSHARKLLTSIKVKNLIISFSTKQTPSENFAVLFAMIDFMQQHDAMIALMQQEEMFHNFTFAEFLRLAPTIPLVNRMSDELEREEQFDEYYLVEHLLRKGLCSDSLTIDLSRNYPEWPGYRAIGRAIEYGKCPNDLTFILTQYAGDLVASLSHHNAPKQLTLQFKTHELTMFKVQNDTGVERLYSALKKLTDPEYCTNTLTIDINNESRSADTVFKTLLKRYDKTNVPLGLNFLLTNPNDRELFQFNELKKNKRVDCFHRSLIISGLHNLSKKPFVINEVAATIASFLLGEEFAPTPDQLRLFRLKIQQERKEKQAEIKKEQELESRKRLREPEHSEPEHNFFSPRRFLSQLTRPFLRAPSAVIPLHTASSQNTNELIKIKEESEPELELDSRKRPRDPEHNEGGPAFFSSRRPLPQTTQAMPPDIRVLKK